jgi:hypothetical protein
MPCISGPFTFLHIIVHQTIQLSNSHSGLELGWVQVHLLAWWMAVQTGFCCFLLSLQPDMLGRFHTTDYDLFHPHSYQLHVSSDPGIGSYVTSETELTLGKLRRITAMTNHSP